MLDAYELGASLYVPATRQDLNSLLTGEVYPELRSLIFCTEDAIHAEALPLALTHLRQLLLALPDKAKSLRCFIRVRNPATLRTLLTFPGIEHLDGFVLPKITRPALTAYMKYLNGHSHLVMPTLETREVFDEHEMRALRQALQKKGVQERVLTLRIGGNDLLSILGMRRPPGRTLYQTPLGGVIARLVTLFKPWDFHLSAPVFEYLNDPATLVREVEDDLAHGLVGKTAIHPHQVPLIHACYGVKATDLEVADRILCAQAPAVFQMQEAMCEPATHRNWAGHIHKSATYFGLHGAN